MEAAVQVEALEGQLAALGAARDELRCGGVHHWLHVQGTVCRCCRLQHHDWLIEIKLLTLI